MLSIVIPAKNEEKYLPILLKSIKEQDFNGKYEIIVADANSTDKTRKIAKEFGCRVIRGGRQSTGRNNGAKVARGETILFLDADLKLPKNFIGFAYSEFHERKLDIASFYLTPMSKNKLDILGHELVNLYYFASAKTKPYVSAMCFMMSKKKYIQLGGLDESLWWDDLAFSNKLPRTIKFGMLPIRLYVSVRRAKKSGRFRQASTMLILAIHRIIGKNYKGFY